MARPPDPDRRDRTLAQVGDYVLEHGLEGVSLRPLAAALGTSTRMLLYDFGSKEALLDEALAEIRRRLAERLAELQSGRDDAATLTEIWNWVSAGERLPFMRLFFETYVAALKDPEVARRIRTVGMEPTPTTPEEFSTFLESEIAKAAKFQASDAKPN